MLAWRLVSHLLLLISSVVLGRAGYLERSRTSEGRPRHSGPLRDDRPRKPLTSARSRRRACEQRPNGGDRPAPSEATLPRGCDCDATGRHGERAVNHARPSRLRPCPRLVLVRLLGRRGRRLPRWCWPAGGACTLIVSSLPWGGVIRLHTVGKRRRPTSPGGERRWGPFSAGINGPSQDGRTSTAAGDRCQRQPCARP
jgi:hypothetical protein